MMAMEGPVRSIALIPVLVFLLAMLLVAVRLLALARRSRRFPELAIGLGVVSIAAVGLPLSIAGRVPQTVGTPLGSTIFALGQLSVAAGVTLFFAFTAHVFHPGRRAARAVVIAACAAALACASGLVQASSGGGELREMLARTRPWAIATVALFVTAFGWSGVESLRHYGRLRRRRALGLWDPVVANRFLLWGIGGVAMVAMAATIAGLLAAGRAVLLDPTALAVMAVCGVVMSATWMLTFVPPAAYCRWLAGPGPAGRPAGTSGRDAGC
jgi:hypothetical protein